MLSSVPINDTIISALTDYGLRSAETAKQLARLLGQHADEEGERFAARMAGFAAVPEDCIPESDLAVPTSVEFALKFDPTGLRGAGYFSGGARCRDLAQTMTSCLANALSLYLQAGGDKREARTLVDTFGIAFPDLEKIACYPGETPGLLVGFASGESGAGMLKAYFHVRLAGVSGYEERVSGILKRAGVPNSDVVEAFSGGSALIPRGVGLDIRGKDNHRAKVYALNPAGAELASVLATISDTMPGITCGPILSALAKFEDTLGSDRLLGTVELAAGLQSKAAPTLKITRFIRRDADADTPSATARFLRAMGYDADGLEAAALTLRGTERRSNFIGQPVNAVGMEFGDSMDPTVNVYLRPTV